MSVWANKKVKKLLRVWCYEVMTFLRTETKMKLRCNVCDDTITEEKCDMQCRVERYSLIIILNLVLFWMTDFWQINYVVKTVFCDISDAATVIKQAFSIRFINNDLSAAWESRDKMQKDSISLLKRLNKYNCIYIQQ